MEQHITKLKPDICLFLVGKNDRLDYQQIGIPDREWQAMQEDSILAERLEMDRQKIRETYSLKSKFIRFTGKSLKQLSKYSEVLSLAFTIYGNIKAYNEGVVYGLMVPEEAEAIEISDKDKEIIKKRMQSNEAKRHFMAYEARLKKLIELSRSNNIEPVFITQPVLYGNAIDDVTKFNWAKLKINRGIILNGELLWQWEEMINNITRNVATNKGCLVVELARELPKSSKYYIDIVHYSNKGNELVADIIYDKLWPYLCKKYKEYAIKGCNNSVTEK